MSYDFLEPTEEQKPCEGSCVNCVDFNCDYFPCSDLHNTINELSQINSHDSQYANSSLSEWLKLETWNIREALLLMSGLAPEGADISWSSLVKITDDFHLVDRIEIKKAQVLESGIWIDGKSVKCVTDKNSMPVENIDEENKVLRISELMMNYFWHIWQQDSYLCNKNRSPVAVYLCWAKRVNVPIHWLGWARSTGLLVKNDSGWDVWSGDSFEETLQLIENRKNRKSQREAEKRELIGNLALADVDKQRFHDIPYEIHISEYFDLDSWSVKEGLLILSGIVPRSANIDWNSHIEYGTGVFQESVKIRGAVILEGVGMSFMDMGHVLMNEVVEKGSVAYSEEEVLQIKDCLDIIGNASGRLNRLNRIWKSGDHSDKRYPISYFINWAQERNIKIEWLDWAKANRHIKNGESVLKIQPAKDMNHPFFANELKIAIESWTALYEDNPPKNIPAGGHKKYIKSYLREHHAELGANAIERISTVINPNPKGGASPISYEN